MDLTFWKAVGIRALRTFLQVVLSIWTVGTAITAIDWKSTLLIAISSAIYSVLTSVLAGLPEVEYEHSYYMDAEEPEDSEVSDEE